MKGLMTFVALPEGGVSPPSFLWSDTQDLTSPPQLEPAYTGSLSLTVKSTSALTPRTPKRTTRHTRKVGTPGYRVRAERGIGHPGHRGEFRGGLELSMVATSTQLKRIKMQAVL